MHELTLLERIGAPQKRNDTPQHRLEYSLARHLTSMLNTRRGSVLCAPDYGIADVTDLGRSFTEESITAFMADLEKTITRYEPRLTSVSIRYMPHPDTPLLPVFSIEAMINTPYGVQILHFETMLDANGVVRLSQGA